MQKDDSDAFTIQGKNTQPLKHFHFLFKGAVNDNMNQIVVNVCVWQQTLEKKRQE